MDWTQIIIALIAALVPTGGLVTIFTLKEKKTDLFLDNASKSNAAWKELADRQEAVADKRQSEIERKEEMLTTQIKMNSTLRKKLDRANTDCAVAQMMRCETLACPNRVPPLGAGYVPKEDEMPE